MSYPTEGYRTKKAKQRFYDSQAFKQNVGAGIVALDIVVAGPAFDQRGFATIPGRSVVPKTPMTVGELLYELQSRGTRAASTTTSREAMRAGALWAIKQAFKQASPQVNFAVALAGMLNMATREDRAKLAEQIRGQKAGGWDVEYFCGSTEGPNFGPFGRNDGAQPCPKTLTLTDFIWNSQINTYNATAVSPKTYRATYLDENRIPALGSHQGELCVRYKWEESVHGVGIPARPAPSQIWGYIDVPVVFEPAILPLVDPMTMPIATTYPSVEIPVLPRAAPTTRPSNPFRVAPEVTTRGPVPARPAVPARVADLTPKPRAAADPSLGAPVSRAPVRYAWPKPPEKGTKEIKLKGVPSGLARVIINGATEFHDVINALYKAIPKGKKPPAFSGIARTRAVWNHLDDIDWNEAMKNLVANQIEDFIYGKHGQLGKSALRKAHKEGLLPPGARGFQSGPWDTVASEADIKGDDPIDAAVDAIWSHL